MQQSLSNYISTKAKPIIDQDTFLLSELLIWKKELEKLFKKPDNGRWYEQNYSRIPVHIIASDILGDKGTFFQHAIIEVIQKRLSHLPIIIRETVQSNGSFDVSFEFTSEYIPRICDEFGVLMTSHDSKLIGEIKCIKINEFKQGAIVDVQRIKPDNFDILILGTHFRNVLNVYSASAKQWNFASNGLSQDRGMRFKFKSKLNLTEHAALLDIEEEICKKMKKIYSISLK